MTKFRAFMLILFLEEIACVPVEKIRVPRNEIQYSNGTIVGTYSYTDRSGNPIAVKYYADHSGYGVELNSFKTMKFVESNTGKEELQNAMSSKDYLEPMKPLIDLAADIIDFDNKLKAMASADTSMTKHPDTFSHLEHETKVIKTVTPDYEKYYQNEVKAPQQCEKDKVRIYLAKEKRKKKNAVETVSVKPTGKNITGRGC